MVFAFGFRGLPLKGHAEDELALWGGGGAGVGGGKHGSTRSRMRLSR